MRSFSSVAYRSVIFVFVNVAVDRAKNEPPKGLKMLPLKNHVGESGGGEEEGSWRGSNRVSALATYGRKMCRLQTLSRAICAEFFWICEVDGLDSPAQPLSYDKMSIFRSVA